MDLIVEHYDDLVLYATNVIKKLNHFVLFEPKDVVHEVFLEASIKPLNKTEVKKRILFFTIKQYLRPCANIILEYFDAPNELSVYSPLDRKYCPKCKTPKYIIYDFSLRIEYRTNGHPFQFYEKHCKACNNKSFYSYKKTEAGKKSALKFQNKYNKNQAKELTDYYIKKTIQGWYSKQGIKRNLNSITDQEIALKRQEIIGIRAGQINRRTKKPK